MERETPTQLIMMSARVARRRGKLVLLSCLLAGVLLGTGGAGYVLLSTVRTYVESPQLWLDLSAMAGKEVSAASTKVWFWPPVVEIKRFELRTETAGEPTPLLRVRELEISVAPLALVILVGDLKAQMIGVEVMPAVEKSKAASSIRPATTGVPKSMAAPKSPLAFKAGPPVLPLRHLELQLLASDIRLPWAGVPPGELELRAQIHNAEKSGGVEADLSQLKIFGLKAAGKLALDGRMKTSVALELPVEGSWLSGKVSGELQPGSLDPKINFKLRLPNTNISIPSQTRWLAGAKLAELRGRAKLAGEGSFALEHGAWSADATWDADMSGVNISYGDFEKPINTTATTSGHFQGTGSDWKLENVAANLGPAEGKLSAVATRGQGVRVNGQVAQFEISRLLPMFFHKKSGKNADRIPQVLGRAQLGIDIVLPEVQGALAVSEPTGSVTAVLEDWELDGPTVAELLGGSIEASGKLEAKGKVAFELERGAFRDATIRAVVDATDLGARFKDLVQKSEGQPLVIDLAADGSGRALAIKSFRLQGPGGLKIAAKGSVSDLKEYLAKLTISESHIPLGVLGEFVPKANKAAGNIELAGEMQGSLKFDSEFYAKLDWRMKNVEWRQDPWRVHRLNGELQTIFSVAKGGDEEGSRDKNDEDGIEPGQAWILRTPGLSGVLQRTGVGDLDASFTSDISYRNRALTGELNGKFSAIDVPSWLAVLAPAKSADKVVEDTHTPLVAKPPKQAGGLAEALPPGFDLKHSRFKLLLSAPAIQLPDLFFHDASLILRLGGSPEFEVERISGHALGGELTVKAKAPVLASGAVSFSANAQGISMAEVSNLLARYSGKDTKHSMYGTGDLSVEGHAVASAPDVLATTELSGTAEIKDGGFKFLPLPGELLEKLRVVPGLDSRLPLEKGTGRVDDKLENAHAAFHLLGDKLDLDVTAADSRMGLRAKGFVTLGGHCDLSGVVLPNGNWLKLPADFGLAEVPFTSRGDNWSCGFSPELGPLAGRIAKSVLLEKASAVVPQPIKNSLKGLFGR